MATWTLYTTEVSGGELTQDHIVVLGNSLYYVNSGGGVSQYNKDTDTVTVVLDPATVGITAALSVANFKGVLYASGYSGSNSTEVWQYGGTANNWTQVLAKNNSGVNSADMLCNDDFIMCVEQAYVGGVWVSSDGTNWAAASTVPVNGYLHGLSNGPRYSSQWTLTFRTAYQTGEPPSDTRTSQLTGASTVAVIADYSTHLASAQNDDFVWFENSGSGDYEYSTGGTIYSTSPNGGTIYPVASQDMPYTIGGDSGSGTVYYFISDVWTAQGTVSASVSSGFRFSDGTVMVVDGSGGLYASDEIIGVLGDGLRYLRLAADNGYLYYTGIENGTISAWHRNLSDLAPAGTATFGTTDFTDPDGQTAGLYPVTRPGADNIVYAFGRANDKQVYFNDLNGTLGWQDIGAGTATWETTKFCTALLPDVLNPPDVIAAFSDGDIYRSDDNTGTGNWTLMGTAAEGTVAVGLRQAGLRYALSNNEVLLAGTAAGTLMYTPNYGVSWDEVGGTAIGTINWITESY